MKEETGEKGFLLLVELLDGRDFISFIIWCVPLLCGKTLNYGIAVLDRSSLYNNMNYQRKRANFAFSLHFVLVCV